MMQNLSYIIEFVSFMYIGKVQTLNIARQTMFMTVDKEKLQILPPSDDALEMHVWRSCYQAGWVWGNTLVQKTSSSPYGWAGTFVKVDYLLPWQQQEHWVLIY